MPNTINTNVYTSTGQTIPTGAYVVHPIHLADLSRLETEGRVELKLRFYTSKQDMDAGFEAITPIVDLTNQVRISLNYGVDGITSMEEAFTICQTKVTEYLKSLYGDGNVE